MKTISNLNELFATAFNKMNNRKATKGLNNLPSEYDVVVNENQLVIVSFDGIEIDINLDVETFLAKVETGHFYHKTNAMFEQYQDKRISASKEAPVESVAVEIKEVIIETPEAQEEAPMALETPIIESIDTDTGEVLNIDTTTGEIITETESETMRELTTPEWNKAEAAIVELAKTDLVARSLYNSYSDGDAGTTEYDIFAYVESKKNSISPIDAYHVIKDLCEDRFTFCELKGNRVIIESTDDALLVPAREIANRAGLTVTTNSMVSSATKRNKTASSFGDLF